MYREYEKWLKIWNILYWISIIGAIFTLLFAIILIGIGMSINWFIWIAVGLYIFGAINAQVVRNMLKKEMDDE